jgi:hypothetical protein
MVKISCPVLLSKYFTISKCLESSVRIPLCGRGGGGLSHTIVWDVPPRPPRWWQREQAEPSDGPFAQRWQQARGPTQAPPTHAVNRGPGYLERFPCWSPQWGRPKPKQGNTPVHSTGTKQRLYAEAFDMRPQSLFPPTSQFHAWTWFAAHDKVPQLQLKPM